MKLLDGKATSQQIKDELAQKVIEFKEKGLKIPHLAAVLVGNDGASLTYVNAKVKACQEIGFGSTLISLPADTTEDDLLNVVADLNNNPEIDGFIVQVPLPHHIDEQKIIEAIDPKKDVDGFHPVNMGKMVLGLPTMIPATPKGIMMLLDKNGVEISGKNVVVIGRSHTVGTPVSILMSRNTGTNGNGTVTLAHSRTKNLAEVVKQADIVVVAIGKPEFVTKEMVKDGAVIVDVGIHRIEDSSKKSGFTLKGDVKYDEVAEKCSYISPVPGGVGPMTIAALLYNTYLAVKIN
jgi:methylenetetrahydrofolate dehydrogenase (NADP+) / methenyltetrahydrofolate cyclohydrolase